MSNESCGVCGGDGRLTNSFGSDARCPACHGTGLRGEDDGVFRDVTKTKASHHRPTNVAAGKPEKQTWPSTFEGGKLADEIKACATLSNDTKLRLTREIIEYEGTHGKCTQTFAKKIRRQLRPSA
jgi:DnaJ-class molecular chaperone